jgi:hypothetical protein
MNTATFTTLEAAAAVLAKTGRTWTAVKCGKGVKVRALMATGWRTLTEIDVHHMKAAA